MNERFAMTENDLPFVIYQFSFVISVAQLLVGGHSATLVGK